MCTVASSGCILRACSALFAASDEADWYDPASYHVRSVLCSRCPKPLDSAWAQDSSQVQLAHHPAEDQERGQVDVNEKNTSLLGCDVFDECNGFVMDARTTQFDLKASLLAELRKELEKAEARAKDLVECE